MPTGPAYTCPRTAQRAVTLTRWGACASHIAVCPVHIAGSRGRAGVVGSSSAVAHSTRQQRALAAEGCIGWDLAWVASALCMAPHRLQRHDSSRAAEMAHHHWTWDPDFYLHIQGLYLGLGGASVDWDISGNEWGTCVGPLRPLGGPPYTTLIYPISPSACRSARDNSYILLLKPARQCHCLCIISMSQPPIRVRQLNLVGDTPVGKTAAAWHGYRRKGKSLIEAWF